MVKVLVTGGSGMVGRNLQDIEGDNPDFVFLSSSDYNLENYYDVKKCFEKFKPSIVVHLAAKVAGLYGNINENLQMLATNCIINVNVINACKEFNVKKLVNISSTCVFPDKVTYPLRSEFILNGPPHSSNSGYAIAKRLMHSASKILSECTLTKVINLIPTNLYGKYDNYDSTRSHVVPALIRKVENAKKTGTVITLSGSGSAMRQFLLASDFAKIIHKCVYYNMKENFLSIIVSPPADAEISISSLVLEIIESFNMDNAKIEYDCTLPDGQYKKTADNSELEKVFPGFEFTSLKDGLAQIINNV